MNKAFLFIISIFLLGNLHTQNSFNAIKTTHRSGIMSTLINPAELGGMHKRFDLHIFGLDMQVANNVANFTSSELGNTDGFGDKFLNSVGAEGLNVNINLDVLGPGLAFAYNKKTTFGLSTRARFLGSLSNIDIVAGKAIVDGNTNGNTSLPYTTPSINNMSATATAWGELSGSIGSEVYNTLEHSIKLGGTMKVLFAGAYANTYMNNFKATIDTLAGGNVQVSNANGLIGIEYFGSSDPLESITSNLMGAPRGLGFDLGVSYQFKDIITKKYIVKLGASILDIGSLSFDLPASQAKKFQLNPSANFDPKAIKGDNLDETMTNISNSGIATELTPETNIKVNLPMAANFQLDWNIYKPLYITVNVQRALTDKSNPRNLVATNYLSIIPRFAVKKIFEVYLPYTYADMYGSVIGAGFKLGPVYAGSSSIVTALASQSNKAIDFHFGFTTAFGKKMQESKK